LSISIKTILLLEEVSHYPRERESAIKKITNGARVARIYYPLNFRIYHQATIAWQLRKIVQFKPKHIAYHLPTKEYHDYVNVLEEKLGMSLKPYMKALIPLSKR